MENGLLTEAVVGTVAGAVAEAVGTLGSVGSVGAVGVEAVVAASGT